MLQLQMLAQRLDMVHQRRLFLEVHLTEKEFVESVHLFYRLMACYLVRQAIPEYKVGSATKLVSACLQKCDVFYLLQSSELRLLLLLFSVWLVNVLH